MRLFLAVGLVSVFSLNAFAEVSFPKVSEVKITQLEGCGVAPSNGVSPQCPRATTITFVSSTKGLCDQFSVDDITPKDSPSTVLRIVKSEIENCTRPVHEARNEELKLNVDRDLSKGAVFILNPIDVTVKYRQ